jgi:hypothetical protein
MASNTLILSASSRKRTFRDLLMFEVIPHILSTAALNDVPPLLLFAGILFSCDTCWVLTAVGRRRSAW